MPSFNVSLSEVMQGAKTTWQNGVENLRQAGRTICAGSSRLIHATGNAFKALGNWIAQKAQAVYVFGQTIMHMRGSINQPTINIAQSAMQQTHQTSTATRTTALPLEQEEAPNLLLTNPYLQQQSTPETLALEMPPTPAPKPPLMTTWLNGPTTPATIIADDEDMQSEGDHMETSSDYSTEGEPDTDPSSVGEETDVSSTTQSNDQMEQEQPTPAPTILGRIGSALTSFWNAATQTTDPDDEIFVG